MPEIIIRTMTEKDLQEVAAIENQVFSDPWSYQAFKSDLGNELSYPLVAEIDHKIAGYSSLYIIFDEVQIGNLAVSPLLRRQGIGKALMSEIISLSAERRCSSIFLEVRESNATARQLYSSFGFKVMGRRVGYYRGPVENAILMIKEL
jgi:ribosomal-protein-alanine N-acetyltransferase